MNTCQFYFCYITKKSVVCTVYNNKSGGEVTKKFIEHQKNLQSLFSIYCRFRVPSIVIILFSKDYITKYSEWYSQMVAWEPVNKFIYATFVIRYISRLYFINHSTFFHFVNLTVNLGSLCIGSEYNIRCNFKSTDLYFVFLCIQIRTYFRNPIVFNFISHIF